MTRIAIVGAGQAGLLAAHGLLQAGYEVTLYSDKTPEDFLTKARPTGTAARFGMALDYERSLGLEHWGDVAPNIDGVHLTFCQKLGNQLLTLLGRARQHWLAIDVRLQSATWMREFAEQGGGVEIEQVTVERLDEIAAANDLTIVAAGRGDIQALFERDPERSTYDAPQRRLAMVCVAGVPTSPPYAPWMTPVKFNFFAPHGEMFWVPWYSKDGERSMSLVFEAKEGGPIDRFGGLRSAEEVLATGLEVIRDLTPWDHEWLRDSHPCDDNAWLVGAFPPTVRRVVGTLPSGRHVMALGDTAHAQDPIAGQGANNGNKMARTFVEAIVERGDGPFDAAFMEAAMDRFWQRHHWIEKFTSTLLEPITPAGRRLLVAQYGSTGRPGEDSGAQRVANAFVDNFSDPAELTPAFHSDERSREVLRQAFGSSRMPVMKGYLRVAKGQLRQALGRPAGHPGT